MTVVNAEKRTLRPLFVRSIGRFQYVQNDRNSVLIICSDYPLISISSISYDMPIALHGTLSRLMVRDYDLMCRLQRHLCHHLQLLCDTGRRGQLRRQGRTLGYYFGHGIQMLFNNTLVFRGLELGHVTTRYSTDLVLKPSYPQTIIDIHFLILTATLIRSDSDFIPINVLYARSMLMALFHRCFFRDLNMQLIFSLLLIVIGSR